VLFFLLLRGKKGENKNKNKTKNLVRVDCHCCQQKRLAFGLVAADTKTTKNLAERQRRTLHLEQGFKRIMRTEPWGERGQQGCGERQKRDATWTVSSFFLQTEIKLALPKNA
jgi:hypothetical protein